MVTPNGLHVNDIESGSILPESISYGSLKPSVEGSTSSIQRGCSKMDTVEESDNLNRLHKSHKAIPDQKNDNASHPAHNEHLLRTRQYYRDMMLGVNDGLVSTLLLVAGVVGGGMSVTAVLLTAVSGAIAGAISMFVGEFVATKSQNQVMSGEINLEKEHIKNYHTEELQELNNLLALIGIPSSSTNLNNLPDDTLRCEGDQLQLQPSEEEIRELSRIIKKYYAANTAALLKIMVALELGVIGDETRSPLVAGGTSFVCFFIGALPSTVPFALVSDSNMGLLSAGIATGVGLCIVGAVKSWATRGNFFLSALENLSITACGGGIAYGIGVVFQNLIGDGSL